MPTGDTVGISRPVWLHFLVVLALTSQYKAGKQFPCWSLPRTPRPQPGTVCFLRKYRHEVLCAGARRDLAGCPVSPSFSGAGVGGGSAWDASRALPHPRPLKCISNSAAARRASGSRAGFCHSASSHTWQRPPGGPEGLTGSPGREHPCYVTEILFS